MSFLLNNPKLQRSVSDLGATITEIDTLILDNYKRVGSVKPEEITALLSQAKRQLQQVENNLANSVQQ